MRPARARMEFTFQVATRMPTIYRVPPTGGRAAIAPLRRVCTRATALQLRHVVGCLLGRPRCDCATFAWLRHVSWRKRANVAQTVRRVRRGRPNGEARPVGAGANGEACAPREAQRGYQPPPPPPPPPPPEKPPPPDPPNELDPPLLAAGVVAKLELENAVDHRARVKNGEGPLYQSGAP